MRKLYAPLAAAAALLMGGTAAVAHQGGPATERGHRLSASHGG